MTNVSTEALFLNERTFGVGGTSVLHGRLTLRWANNLKERIKVLHRNGHKDVKLRMMSGQLSKVDCVKEMLTMECFSDEATQALMQEYLKYNDVEAL